MVIVIKSSLCDFVTDLIESYTWRYTPYVAACVSVVSVLNLPGAKLKLTPASPLINLLEDIIGADFVITV